VLRCVDALRQGGLARSLEAVGLIDRDFHRDEYLSSLPEGVRAAPVHEIESFFALPAVVEAVAQHLAKPFDLTSYTTKLRSAISDVQRHGLVIQRWKAAVEPHLTGLVSSTSKRDGSLSELVADIPAIFDMNNWGFSPQDLLALEQKRVEEGLNSADALALLALAPGKSLLPIAARFVGMEVLTYTNLIIETLRRPAQEESLLRDALVLALQPHLPQRSVPAAGASGLLPFTP